MVSLKELSAAGVAVIDEVVRCNESVVVGGVTYYRGYLAYTCNPNIKGNDSPTYGFWTAVAKGGTRKNVLLAGYPADATAVVVDPYKGWVYATAAITLYVRYLAHEPIRRGPGSVEIAVPWLLASGAAATLGQYKPAGPWKVGAVALDVQGGPPSADATISLSNGTESAAITLPAAGGQTVVELTVPLKFTASETLTASTPDGKGAFGVTVRLLDV